MLSKSLLYLSLFSFPATALADEEGTPYQTKATNSAWETKEIDPGFYDSPYRISLFSPQSDEDNERLRDQTYTVFGSGFAVLGVLALMPESVTKWDDRDDRDEKLLEKWLENVKAGPVWDRDSWHLNVIGHGYFGGVYYQSARKSGYRQWDAFLYSFLMSTLYWEYGIEAFAEVPSIQDIVLTPVIGWAYGEWAFNTEREIWNNGGKFLDSQTMGDVSLFLLDPVDTIGRSVNTFLGRDYLKAGTGYFTFSQDKLGDGEAEETVIGFNVKYLYGTDDSPALPGISKNRHKNMNYTTRTVDPVDTGIIGFSLGRLYVAPDESWALKDGYGYQWSLGLYFTKSLSARLNYSYAELEDKQSDQKVDYETYALDTQYYFNSDANFRPYLTAGFGELMFKKSRDHKTFQINGGVGLHYKIHNNWAVQVDWRNIYTTKLHTNEQQISSSILYRFGKGE